MNEWMKRGKHLLNQYKQVLLVIAVGIILMLLPTGTGEKPAPEQAVSSQGEGFDLEAFQTRLEQVLSQVEGAGETRVVLSLDGGNRQVLAQNEERDAGGGFSSSTVTLGRGSGEQSVVPLQTIAPQFRGALVVCPGGDDPRVRLELAQALSALTGLGSDRISICKGSPS